VQQQWKGEEGISDDDSEGSQNDWCHKEPYERWCLVEEMHPHQPTLKKTIMGKTCGWAQGEKSPPAPQKNLVDTGP
jgi:hypothetical protein